MRPLPCDHSHGNPDRATAALASASGGGGGCADAGGDDAHTGPRLYFRAATMASSTSSATSMYPTYASSRPDWSLLARRANKSQTARSGR